MTGKLVVVTGAAGFIGRHVASEFASQGWRVIGIGRGEWTSWRDCGLSDWYSTSIEIGSLLEYAGKPDVIVHCAGGASVGFSVEQPAIDFELTVKTTSNVLEFMRVHSPDTQLIYLSSAAVYGQVEAQPITEEAALKPVSPYGLHKQMSESLCQLYSRQFGVSVTIVRLFSIYGEGLRKQLLWDACQKFERGESEFFGTGEEVRDWLHVKDVAGLLFAVAENVTTPYPVINAGSGDGVTVSEILQYVSEQLGLGLKPRFTSRPKVGDPNVYIADVIKARSCGWEPKINWRKGVEDYVDWYKKCR